MRFQLISTDYRPIQWRYRGRQGSRPIILNDEVSKYLLCRIFTLIKYLFQKLRKIRRYWLIFDAGVAGARGVVSRIWVDPIAWDPQEWVRRSIPSSTGLYWRFRVCYYTPTFNHPLSIFFFTTSTFLLPPPFSSPTPFPYKIPDIKAGNALATQLKCPWAGFLRSTRWGTSSFAHPPTP